jgi:TetR/AcrR family transcriptional repressor of nem operon
MPWEKQFDRDAALKRALQVFWKRGYGTSSMDVLLKGMGIQKGSFYATFRSKHHLLVEALELYVRQRFEGIDAKSRQRSPLATLRRHLDDVVRESSGTQRFMGCFLVNCALELAPRDRAVRDIVERALDTHAKIYAALLADARTRRELPAAVDVNARASALLGLVLGMRVLARGGMPATAIAALRAHAEALLGA